MKKTKLGIYGKSHGDPYIVANGGRPGALAWTSINCSSCTL